MAGKHDFTAEEHQKLKRYLSDSVLLEEDIKESQGRSRDHERKAKELY